MMHVNLDKSWTIFQIKILYYKVWSLYMISYSEVVITLDFESSIRRSNRRKRTYDFLFSILFFVVMEFQSLWNRGPWFLNYRRGSWLWITVLLKFLIMRELCCFGILIHTMMYDGSKWRKKEESIVLVLRLEYCFLETCFFSRNYSSGNDYSKSVMQKCE